MSGAVNNRENFSDHLVRFVAESGETPKTADDFRRLARALEEEYPFWARGASGRDIAEALFHREWRSNRTRLDRMRDLLIALTSAPAQWWRGFRSAAEARAMDSAWRRSGIKIEFDADARAAREHLERERAERYPGKSAPEILELEHRRLFGGKSDQAA